MSNLYTTGIIIADAIESRLLANPLLVPDPGDPDLEVIFTYGETGWDACRRVMIWPQTIAPRTRVENPGRVTCAVQTQVTYQVRALECYEVTADPASEGSHQVDAEDVAELVWSVWRALVQARAAGDLGGSCNDVVLSIGTAVVPSGGMAGMEFGVTLPLNIEEAPTS